MFLFSPLSLFSLSHRKRARAHARIRSLQHARSLALSLGAMSDGAAGDPPAPEPATATTADDAAAAAAAGADPAAPAAERAAAPPADAARKNKRKDSSAPKRRFAAGRVSIVWTVSFFFLRCRRFRSIAINVFVFFFLTSIALVSLSPLQKPSAGAGRRCGRRERR